MDTLWQDVRYAARGLAKSRGFTVVALATLAVGIGANTAIFSVVDAVVFRSLPYEDPHRLVKVCGNTAARAADDVSLPDFRDLRAQNQAFEQIAADDGEGYVITHADGSTDSVNGAIVTANWLSTLGVRPHLGRDFTEENTAPDSAAVLILGHDYWQRRFGGDPHVLGQTLRVEKRPFTVIGVLPPNVLRYGADFLRPLVPAEYSADRRHRDLDVFARLKPGVTLAQARSDVQTVAQRLAQMYPETNRDRGMTVVPLGKYYASIQPKAGYGLLLLLGAVGLVLLIACVNVANLLLARAWTRSRECVIRASLGATRVRLVRQLLVEGMLLFTAGGVLGVGLARATLDGLVALGVSTDYIPRRLAVSLDVRVLAFGLITSLLTGLLFGLLPALHASRVDLNQALRDTGPAGRRRSGPRRLLIVSEVALSLVLLVGFGLLVRSFMRVHATSGGFDATNLLVTESEPGRSFAPAVAFCRAALARVRALPGVQSAAMTSRPPVHGSRQQSFVVEGTSAAAPGQEPSAGDILVSAGYFQTMGIPLLRGRAFLDSDDGAALPVAIVSESVARAYFPGQDPIGRRLSVRETSRMSCCSTAAPPEGVWREIVGVVADVRQANLDESPARTLYRPLTQIVEHDMYLVARAHDADAATALTANLRAVLNGVDAGRPWAEVRPMRAIIRDSESVRLRRFILLLLGVFTVVALALAMMGIYGVTAQAAMERTHELGIRAALGASPKAMVAHLLTQTMGSVLLGIAMGAAAARLATDFISAMLFDVSLSDPATYGAVAAVLALVALLGAYIPARRAARIDPLRALRHE